MRSSLRPLIVCALLAVTAQASALPEMRCRLGGAYIKVYGQNEAEEKETCERQGGEYTRYSPQAQNKPGNKVPPKQQIWK